MGLPTSIGNPTFNPTCQWSHLNHSPSHDLNISLDAAFLYRNSHWPQIISYAALIGSEPLTFHTGKVLTLLLATSPELSLNPNHLTPSKTKLLISSSCGLGSKILLEAVEKGSEGKTFSNANNVYANQSILAGTNLGVDCSLVNAVTIVEASFGQLVWSGGTILTVIICSTWCLHNWSVSFLTQLCKHHTTWRGADDNGIIIISRTMACHHSHDIV